MDLKVLFQKNSKFNRKRIVKKFGGKVLLVLGLIIFFMPFLSRFVSSFQMALYVRNNINVSPFTNQTVEQVVGNYPVRIIIPQLKIDLPVKPSKVINGFWEIHAGVANFGVGSSLPEENGNTVIFAHAKKKQFGPLRAIKKNYEISVQTKNGLWYTYKVVEKKEVKPYDVEVIGPTSDKTLTLFTCSGFADSKRLIVIAK